MIARDQRVWLGGYDVTGALNALGLELGLEGHDATVFGDTTRRSVAGLKTIRAEHQGYFDVDSVDSLLFDARSLDGQVMSVIVSGAGTAGSIAYSFPASVAEYSPGGRVGEQLAFSVSAEAAGTQADIGRGTVLYNGLVETGTTESAYRTLGVVAATQRLYGVVHVFSTSGQFARLDVSIESDLDPLLPPPPEERIDFSRMTAIGSQWKTVAGPMAEQRFRAKITVAGGLLRPTFRVAVLAGIL